MLTGKQAVSLLQTAYTGWSAHKAPRLGAALAFYMLLSIAPLMILLVTIFGLVLTRDTARQQILTQVHDLAGPSAERAVHMMINNAKQPKSGTVATLIALITLLSGASGVFLELRDSLNTIWDAPPARMPGIWTVVWQRLISFGMVLALGLLLLVSLVLSAAITIAEKFFFHLLPMNAIVLGHIANFFVPLIAISALFALIFKFVPDIPIDWRDVSLGAFATALLFSIGKYLLALYLGTLGVGSTYGAAGSLVAFVVWVYYSAQIFFFGAALTKAHADCFGSLSGQKNSTGTRTPDAGLLARRQSA